MYYGRFYVFGLLLQTMALPLKDGVLLYIWLHAYARS